MVTIAIQAVGYKHIPSGILQNKLIVFFLRSLYTRKCIEPVTC